MRQDQFEKLQQLEEKLVDTFLVEADPEGWPGHGLQIAAMDPQTRGDRYWSKKNAAATGVLVQRVSGLIGGVQQSGAGTSPPAGEGDAQKAREERQLDDEIARAEREAERLMRELQAGAAKKAFDRKVHGRT